MTDPSTLADRLDKLARGLDREWAACYSGKGDLCRDAARTLRRLAPHDPHSTTTPEPHTLTTRRGVLRVLTERRTVPPPAPPAPRSPSPITE